jgi:hypothetical protein
MENNKCKLSTFFGFS